MIGLLAKASSGPRSKWVVIAVWVGLLVVSLPAAMTIDEVTSDQTATADSLPNDSDAARVAEELRRTFADGETVLALSVYRRDGGLTAADRAKIAADAKAIQSVAGRAAGARAVAAGAPELVSAGRRRRRSSRSRSTSRTPTSAPMRSRRSARRPAPAAAGSRCG